MNKLLVLAIGGNALDSPGESYARERERILQLAPVFARLAALDYRLLIVHGNGPQVGHLMDRAGGVEDLDIHVAQTQGELGYLLAQTLPTPNLCILTRVRVPSDQGEAVKPIGPFTSSPHPSLPGRQFANGWRVIVPSPRPDSIIELEALRGLIKEAHLVAGGGGGIPLNENDQPVPAVVDKDWIAMHFAIAFDAEKLMFLTNVDHVYTNFGEPQASALLKLDPATCQTLLAGDELGAGSMHPKLSAASEFVARTGRSAHIGAVDALEDMLNGTGGTLVFDGR